MKLRLLDHLVCPLDGTRLELCEWDSRPRHLSDDDRSRCDRDGIAPTVVDREIISGVLINPSRKVLYPIKGGVPRMLTFATGVSQAFAAEYGERLRNEFAGYNLPNEESMPGEADVLRTFSSEWVNYDWNGQTYWGLTPEAWFESMAFALRFEQYPAEGQLVLEVGTGVGGVADYVSRAQRAEVIGIDLGHAVDVAFKYFHQNTFLHFAQASAFAPPFPNRSIDFVYSFGVIHHTFSTQTAFESLAKLPKDGGRLYVWVYSPFDENRTFLRRTLMKVENVVRPVVWRLPEKAQAAALLPFVPLYIGHQWLRSLYRGGNVIRYGVREAMHAARDRLTPRYIHRHTDEEVTGWFSQAGFEELSCDSQREKPADVPDIFTTCTGVSGIRRR